MQTPREGWENLKTAVYVQERTQQNCFYFFYKISKELSDNDYEQRTLF